MRKVRERVSQVNNLRFNACVRRGAKPMVIYGHVEPRGMSRHAFSCRPGEVEATEVDERTFNLVHYGEGVSIRIPLRLTMVSKRVIERALAGVPEGRMTEIVRESYRACKRLIHFKIGRNPSCKLSYLDYVVKPRSECCGRRFRESLHLGLVL